MEFTIDLGMGGGAAIIVGALLIGLIAQFVGSTNTGYEWVITGLAAAVGAIVGSEFIVGWRAFEPVWDGLALVPALAGGLTFGVVIDVVARYLTGGTYFQRPMSA